MPKCRTLENIAAVRAGVVGDPNLSIPRRVQEYKTTTWRILYTDLNFHPFKIDLTQKL